ncbi:hypothetical protein SEA_TOMAS_169 [Streptomyces phage Tomas]|uniref:Uncharacterized protein n=1 Tax=Streptomyces phage Tomas TaxID=2914443 RepID=A0AA49BTB5_9CAUD|nr:hypothetical protein PP453_gp140 [Streptomyces phage Tomas]UMO76327.1 hypothetical protein SEA_TOMAS_169 [Streptomyces phage Tomas]
MGCFEVNEDKVAAKAAEMIDFMKSPEGKRKLAEVAKSLPDVAKIDYLSLMQKE